VTAIPDQPMPTIEPTEYTLPEYGIAESIKILGAVLKLLPSLNVPIVFLIDENHGSDDCIDQNITNATELIQKAQIELIGVESHEGGLEWNDYDEGRYTDVFNMGANTAPVSTCPRFAESMRASRAAVRGVECLCMSNQEEVDFYPGGSWHGKPKRDHPLNKKRSEHFIRTLLELRSRQQLHGNVILNAGGDHNSDIASWIKDGTIEAKAGHKAAYVRVRAPAFQE